MRTWTEPVQHRPDQRLLVPATRDDQRASRPQAIACAGGRRGVGRVLPSPRLLVQVVGAAQAHADLRMVAQVHHAVGGLVRAAAPALEQLTCVVSRRLCRHRATAIRVAPILGRWPPMRLGVGLFGLGY